MNSMNLIVAILAIVFGLIELCLCVHWVDNNAEEAYDGSADKDYVEGAGNAVSYVFRNSISTGAIVGITMLLYGLLIILKKFVGFGPDMSTVVTLSWVAHAFAWLCFGYACKSINLNTRADKDFDRETGSYINGVLAWHIITWMVAVACSVLLTLAGGKAAPVRPKPP